MSLTQTEKDQLDRIEKKVDTLTRVVNALLVMLQEEDDEPELPNTTLDGAPAGAAREEGNSLG